MIWARRCIRLLTLITVMGAAGFGVSGFGVSGLSAAGATTAEIEPPAGELTVVMTEMPPFVENDGGKADGFYAEIWDDVARDLGVDYQVIWVDSFAELLPALEAGEADVAIAPLTPTAEREAAFDFTAAVIGSGPQLGYHERIQPSASVVGALFSPAIRWVMLAALGGLLALAHLIWLVERHREDEEGNDFADSYLRGIWDGFWWATVTVTTVGYGDKAPRSNRGRVVALLAMFLSVFMVGAFVSQVSDDLRQRRAEVAVGTLEDLNGRPVGAVTGSSFADFLIDQEVNVVGYDSQEEVFQAVESGEIDIMVANPFAVESLGPRYGVLPSGEVLYEEFESFGLAQGSAWREPINQVIADLQASGEVEEIVDRWQN